MPFRGSPFLSATDWCGVFCLSVCLLSCPCLSCFFVCLSFCLPLFVAPSPVCLVGFVCPRLSHFAPFLFFNLVCLSYPFFHHVVALPVWLPCGSFDGLVWLCPLFLHWFFVWLNMSGSSVFVSTSRCCHPFVCKVMYSGSDMVIGKCGVCLGIVFLWRSGSN